MAAFVDSMFPINFNTHVMSIEMETATQMLEEAGYHFVYIQRLKSIQTTLANGKSKNVTLGSLKDFSKKFKQAFAKGINPETADVDIVRVFSKIAAICARKENVENESLRSEKVKQCIQDKINKRRQNLQNKQQQREQKQQEQQQEMGNNGDDNDGDGDSPANHNERHEREEKSMELLQNTSENADSRRDEDAQDDNERVIRQERKIDQEYGEEDDMNVSDMQQDFSNLNIGDSDNNSISNNNENDSKSNNDDKEKCESLLYWQKVEKTTKKEIKIGMTLNRKNFPHLESKDKQSRHVLAKEIYYAYLKMGENPQRSGYDAYPRSGKKIIMERQAMLMMIILDCKEFDRLFDLYSAQREKLEQQCKISLAKLKKSSKWGHDKKVRSNTRLPLIFHWYRCTFDTFWGSIKLSLD